MSDYTRTPNLGLYKPNYALDVGQWGNHLNFNSDKLDSVLGGGGGLFLPLTGGDVTGPVTITQAGGGGTPHALKISRDSAAPLATGFEYVTEQVYTIDNDGVGTTDTTFNVNQTLRNYARNAHDGTGAYVGATNGQTIVQYSELNTSAAVGWGTSPSQSSMHINHWITSHRTPDPRYTPTVAHPYGQMWGTLWNLLDDTGLPSSLGGAILNELDVAANNLDDAKLRSGLVFIMSSRLQPGAGVVPCEWGHALAIGGLYGDGPLEGTFVTTTDISGNYSVAAIELRQSRVLNTVVRTTLTSPSTVVAVDSILPFTKSDWLKNTTSVDNPLPVMIGSGTYSCIGCTLTGYGANGTITLATNVSVADGTAGNVAERVSSAAIWLPTGGRIAWDTDGRYLSGYSVDMSALFHESAATRWGTRSQQIEIYPTGVRAKSIGVDANLELNAQGNGVVQIGSAEHGGGFQVMSPIGPTVNIISTSGAVAGGTPQFSVGGADADIGMAFVMKGAGVFAHVGVGGILIGGPLQVSGPAGFNGVAPLAKPSVTGSRGGNAALAALLTALASYGLVTDGTVA